MSHFQSLSKLAQQLTTEKFFYAISFEFYYVEVKLEGKVLPNVMVLKHLCFPFIVISYSLQPPKANQNKNLTTLVTGMGPMKRYRGAISLKKVLSAAY